MWTPFLEKINQIMLQEKKARQESDHVKGAELCCSIVSHFALENFEVACEMRLILG